MIEEYFSLRNIVFHTRKTGNTTWILKSAIKYPNCVIVAHSMQYAQELEKQYFNMLAESPWHRKLYWKIFGRKHPKFTSINSRFEGTKLPVIFDNSVLS